MKKLLFFITLLCIQHFVNATDIYNLHDALLFLASITPQKKNNTELKLASGVSIHLQQGDITKLRNIDAIVNAANKELASGGGVCGAIFSAAGEDELQKACNAYTNDQKKPIEIGEARITESFKLKNQGIKFIIHAVGPNCSIGEDRTLLTNAYVNSLKLAQANDIKTIAFPFISSAIYGCELNFASQAALDALITFPYKQNGITDVYMTLFSKKDLDLFIAKLATYAKK